MQSWKKIVGFIYSSSLPVEKKIVVSIVCDWNLVYTFFLIVSNKKKILNYKKTYYLYGVISSKYDGYYYRYNEKSIIIILTTTRAGKKIISKMNVCTVQCERVLSVYCLSAFCNYIA